MKMKSAVKLVCTGTGRRVDILILDVTHIKEEMLFKELLELKTLEEISRILLYI